MLDINCPGRIHMAVVWLWEWLVIVVGGWEADGDWLEPSHPQRAHQLLDKTSFVQSREWDNITEYGVDIRILARSYSELCRTLSTVHHTRNLSCAFTVRQYNPGNSQIGLAYHGGLLKPLFDGLGDKIR